MCSEQYIFVYFYFICILIFFLNLILPLKLQIINIQNNVLLINNTHNNRLIVDLEFWIMHGNYLKIQ